MAHRPPESLPDLAAPLRAAATGWRFPLAVAYSGGADSTALLHASQACWPGQVVALHVHHGLQAAADDFAQHCQQVCDALQVPLHTTRVNARHAAGDSPEDAARQARYAALAELATQAGAHGVLLAQHADDQVETLLLALSRGAGLPGLAAMPPDFERHGLRFHRPWLGVAAADIRRWLQARSLPFVEDPSNTNTAFTRNKIRLQLLPVLATAFPQFRETFARSARHAAQAQELLTALAELDLAHTGEPPAIQALQALSDHRQANVLRHWLKTRHQALPSTAQMDALLQQVAACTTRGHQIHLKVAAGFVTRHGGRLTYTCGL